MDEGLVEALRVQRSRTSRTRTLLCLGSHSIKFNLAPASSFIAVTPAINSTSSDGLAAFTASFRMNLHNIPCPAPSTLHPNYRARERVVRVARLHTMRHLAFECCKGLLNLDGMPMQTRHLTSRCGCTAAPCILHLRYQKMQHFGRCIAPSVVEVSKMKLKSTKRQSEHVLKWPPFILKEEFQ